MEKVPIILGPTSSGKTTLALSLCQKYGGEIISADSRQVYKFMDVGTGKLPNNSKAKVVKKENYWHVDGVKIWGYDLVTPNDYFSAFDYAQFALKKISTILSAGKKVFLVGGTGFYIDMVIGRIRSDGAPPDLELRRELEQLPLRELQDKLEKLDSDSFAVIDKQNPARLVRTIEKKLTKDKPHSALPYLKNVEFVTVGLTADRNTLYSRADNWLEAIWTGGLLEEVSSLLNSEYKDSPKLRGLIYKTAVAYLRKELAEEEAKQKAKFDLHAYIRRQQTYFKKMPGITWLNVAQDNKLETVYNILNG